MKIRMQVEKTGPRYDQRSWPPPGGEIDVPDEEGVALCRQGDAIPVPQPERDVEKRVTTPKKPAAETRNDPPAAPPARA